MFHAPTYQMILSSDVILRKKVFLQYQDLVNNWLPTSLVFLTLRIRKEGYIKADIIKNICNVLNKLTYNASVKVPCLLLNGNLNQWKSCHGIKFDLCVNVEINSCDVACSGRRPTTGSRQKYSAAKAEVASESLPVAPFTRPLPDRSLSVPPARNVCCAVTTSFHVVKQFGV